MDKHPPPPQDALTDKELLLNHSRQVAADRISRANYRTCPNSSSWVGTKNKPNKTHLANSIRARLPDGAKFPLSQKDTVWPKMVAWLWRYERPAAAEQAHGSLFLKATVDSVSARRKATDTFTPPTTPDRASRAVSFTVHKLLMSHEDSCACTFVMCFCSCSVLIQAHN